MSVFTNELKTRCLANSLQQGFIYQSINAENSKPSNNYVLIKRWVYETGIEADILKKAWICAQQKYPSLRLNFSWDDEMVQIINNEAPEISWIYTDVTQSSEEEKTKIINDIELKEKSFIYDLHIDKLFRINLIKCSNTRFECIFSCHHAILDGMSMTILLNFVHQSYINLLQGHDVDSTIDTAYILAQQYLQNNKTNNIEYWKVISENFDNKEDLAFLLKPESKHILQSLSNDSEPKYQEIKYIFNESDSKQLHSLCEKYGITINSLFQYCWHKILSIYNNTDTTIVGTVCNGRSIPVDQIQESVGLYINTLPVFLKHGDIEAIKQIQELEIQINKSNAKSDISLSSLQTNGEKLFNSLFFYEKSILGENTIDKTLSIKYSDIEVNTEYPLCITVAESKKDILLKMEFAENHIEADFIHEIIKQIKLITIQLLNDEAVSSKKITLLTKEDYEKVINHFNDTDFLDSKRIKNIVSLFEEQVDLNGDKTALVYEDIALSYKALNEKVNQFSNYLINVKHIQKGDFIGLCLDRSHNMIVSILSVLKIGATYIPISPQYPKDRIQYILNDTAAKILITNDVFINEIVDVFRAEDIVCIEDEFLWNSYSSENLGIEIEAEDNSYIIYTSGTTGNPKGVVVQHKGVVNLICYLKNIYKMPCQQNVLLFANYVFDASAEQIYLALLGGHKLVVIKNNIWLDTDLFIRTLNENEVSYIDMTPSFLMEMPLNELKHLKYIVAGGEAVTKSLLAKIDCSRFTFINTYGPTETTITSVVNLDSKTINIGRPVANTKVYVLDNDLNPLPIGAIGELYISGYGVTKGYLNQPEITSEKFIKNPFHSEKEYDTIYKTGDLVRYLPDGNLEYIGRNDFQVKIRGFRVELGEIENAINSIPNIKQSIVVAENNNTGTKSLIAYYLSDQEMSVEYLTEQLNSALPYYMVPAFFVHLDKLPLTINGKIDKKSLPKIDLNISGSFVAPSSNIELDVCQIIGAILGLEATKLSVSDDFFKLGGDSISSIQLVNRIRQKFDTKLTVKDIFNSKTIKKISNLISINKPSEIEIQSEDGLLNGEINFLPIQNWFFQMKDYAYYPDYNHYNQSFIVNVPALDLDLFKLCIVKLVEFHDILRAHYEYDTESNIYKQYYASEFHLPEIEFVKSDNLDDESLNSLSTKWHRSFNIFEDRTFKVLYLEGADQCQVWFFFHHLIIDSVSWRIIKDHFEKLYTFYKTNGIDENPDFLIKKGTSYRQWVNRINIDYKNQFIEEKSFWNNEIMHLSAFNERMQKIKTAQKQIQTISLDGETTNSLLREVNNRYNTTINDVLLSALSCSLQELTSLDSNYVLLEGHGRENIWDDIDTTNTVGWFTSMFPVRLSEKQNSSVDSLIYLKEKRKSIPHNGLGYGAHFQYNIDDLPKVSFNYLGQFDNLQNIAEWSVSSNPYGNRISNLNHDFAIVSITGAVLNSTMSFTFESFLSEETSKKFSDSFRTNLIKLINILKNLDRAYLTRSDIDNIITQDYLDHIQNDREVQNIFLANSLQQGFIYHFVNQGNTDEAYRTQLVWEYNTSIDADKLKLAWEYAVKKYGSLRLRFSWEDELVQIIDQNGILRWNYIDISNSNDIERESYLNKLICDDRKLPFDLQETSLFRVYLIKQSHSCYTTLFCCHHAVIDGWSNPVLLRYIHETYQQLMKNESVDIAEDIAYIDSQIYLQHKKNDNVDYWNSQMELAEEENLTSLLKPELKNSISLSDYRHIKECAEKTIYLEKSFCDKLKSKCREYGFTANALFQYSWHKMLNIYSNNGNTIIGVVSAGRSLPIDNIEQSVGLYINTLPVIHEHIAEPLNKQIYALQNKINEANSRSYVNLSSLQKNGSRSFCTLFVFESYPDMQDDSVNNSMKFEIKQSIEKLDYPISIIVVEEDKQLFLTAKYAAELFDEQTINSLLSGMQLILEQFLSNPEIDCGKLNFLEKDEFEKIIYDWNNTCVPYDKTKTIIELFEEQVNKTPENIAVKYAGKTISYRELNIITNKLSSYLRKTYNIRPDDPVTLCLDRSHHMVIAILSVIKAGGAYVPVGPDFPDERIQYIIDDARSKVTIINSEYKEKIESINPNIVHLSIEDDYLWDEEEGTNLEITVNSSNLAYIIYTSGTTGHPKGVMIEHQGLINRITWMNNEYNIQEGDSVLQKTTYTFDVSVWEFFWPLLYGAKLVMALPGGHKDSSYLIETINEEKITIMHFVPSMLNIFQETLSNITDSQTLCNTLRYIFCSGEALSLNSVKNHHVLLPKTEIHNLYGPTEASIDVLYYDCNDRNISKVLIGKPIMNTSAYILDEYLNPLPIGAIGELHIGGDGLARGYINKNDLTRDKFIPNPFQSEEEKQKGINGRIYKTGDLARFLPTGDIEYIGRNDFQVKIRGFRIELEEIENALNSIKGISSSIVIVWTSNVNNNCLVSYYMSEYEIDESEIREELLKKLPEYMVPTFFIRLDKFPITMNGKLDRKALPAPQYTSNTNSFVEPKNKLQEDIRIIYGDILGVDSQSISIDDDFFRLGGDSISSIQLVNRIRQKMNLHISVKDIFAYKTIRDLSNFLSAHCDVASIVAEQGRINGDIPLLPIQEWFFSIKDKGLLPVYNHWNQSFLIDVPELNLTILDKCIENIFEQHDILRTKFEYDSQSGIYKQKYTSDIPSYKINTLDVSTIQTEKELGEKLTSWQSDFDIFNGNVFCIGYLTGYPDKKAKLYFAFHHLIIDSMSWRIIADDIKILYQYYQNNSPALDKAVPVSTILGSKNSSYRQWTDRILNKYRDGHFSEIDYWKEVVKDIPAINQALIKSKENVLVSKEFHLDEDLTSKLIRVINDKYHTTINDVLLTALSLSLARLTNTSKNYVLLEGHGRENIWSDIDISSTVGWFTSMYPVCLEVIDKNIIDTLIHTKENLRKIPNHGIGYGALMGYCKDELPVIIFNYLGQFESSTEEKDWGITPDNIYIRDTSPLNTLGELISINGCVFDNKLSFNMDGFLSNDKMDLLSETFRVILIELIANLSEQSRSYLTVSDVDHVVCRQELDLIQAEKEIDAIYLANSLQQGFISHAVSQGNIDDAYHIQLLWEYHNEIEVNSLKNAWIKAQEKYESLRLRFSWEDNLIQIIDKQSCLIWNYDDITSLSYTNKEKFISQLISEDRSNPFDLKTAPLFRIYLVKKAEDKYFCMMSIHHAIIDGWSNPVLIDFVHNAYLDIISGKQVITILDKSYGLAQKYIHEHRSLSMEYWNNQLELIDDKEDISVFLKPECRSKIKVNSYKYVEQPEEKEISFTSDQYKAIKEFCNRSGFTINALLQYCWHKQLSIYCNTSTTIVGTIASGRNLPVDGIEQSVGLYINTLPVIFKHDKSSVLEQVKLLQEKINELNSRSDVNLSSLHSDGVRLFNTLFSYENYPNKKDNGAIKFDFLESREKVDYILSVNVREYSNELYLSLNYASEIIDSLIIEQLLNGIEHLIEQIILDPVINESNLTYLKENEYNKIVHKWNATFKSYPFDTTIVREFEKQAVRHPDNVAVVYESTVLTYSALNEEVNRLSHYLIHKLQVQANEIIPLYLTKDESMIIAILAVLKSGCSYVPVSPDYPDERSKYILSDTCPGVIITNTSFKSKLLSYNINSEILPIDQKELWQSFPDTNPDLPIRPDDRAYTIYTSGTTGTPKGTIIRHENLTNLVYSQRDVFGLEENNPKKCLWYSNYVFDAHISEIHVAFAFGHSVYILPDHLKLDIEQISAYVKESQIYISTLPPILDTKTLIPLDTLVVAGDVTDKNVMEFYRTNGVRVINGYGPTETTVCATTHEFQVGDMHTNIGRR